MQSLTDNYGLPTVKPAFRFAMIRLASHPDTAPLVGQLAPVRESLAKAEEAHDQAYETWLGATAVVRYLDNKLGLLVSKLARDAYNLVDGNRKDPRYRKLFTTAPSEGMAGIATDPQERYVRTLIDTVEKHADLEALRGHIPAIQTALAELKSQVAQRDELRLQEGIALRDLRVCVDAAKRAYNLLYPRLQLTFPDDPGLVETFFRRLSDAKADDTVVEPSEGETEPTA